MSVVKPAKRVEIEWSDHWGSAGWREIRDLDCSPIACKSIGFLVKESKAGYLIATTVASDGAVGGVSFRARKLVKRIRVLP